MHEPDIIKIAEHFGAILKEPGADLMEPGLRETPARAAQAMEELTSATRTELLMRLNQPGGV